MSDLTASALRSIVDALPDMVCRFRADGAIIFANEAYAATLGRRAAELEGENLWQFVTEEDRAAVEAQLARLTAASPEVIIENQFETGQGRRWTRWKNRALEFDEAGAWSLAQSTGEDITEREASRLALKEAHDSFRNLVEGSPFGVYALDSEFRLRLVSAGARKVFSNVDPLIGRDFAEVLRIVWSEPFASDAIAVFRRTLETGEPYHSPATVEQRNDIGEVEAYDWKVERTRLPDGGWGVVCHFYDLSERERFERRMRASEARLRMAIAAGEAGEWETDDDSQALILSARASQICGLAPGRLELNDAKGLVRPEAIEEIRTVVAATWKSGDPFRIALYLRDGAGAGRWVEVHGVLDGRERKLVGLVRDITQQRTDAERQSLLIGELNHRMKNLFALTQAIAYQSFKGTGLPEAAMQRFEERLNAFGAAHAALTRASWGATSFKDLVLEGIRVCGAASSRINAVGPDIHVSADQAMPLLMAIHELCTNAIKYGSLSSAGGHVDLSWRTTEDPPLLSITWTETGGPPVVVPGRPGFGTAMIEKAIRHQLGGRSRQDFAASGLTCWIEVPLQPPDGATPAVS